ncbi:MAG TPA: hypothetical protein VGR96_06890 [Acidobacteriaceae bacterium]|nr:hypothetical protein [Acidobacteriaceae bacterium]
MVISAFLHGFGSYQVYRGQPMVLLWAESAGLAEVLLAALNLLRAGRPEDRPLAWVAAAGCSVWLGAVGVFGHLIGNILDFRVLIQAFVTVVLLVFSLRGAVSSGDPRRAS